MNIVILKDHIEGNNSVDMIDNLVEAQFAQRYLSVKHHVTQIDFVPDIEKMIAELKNAAPDLVFNLVETVCNSGALSIIAVQLLEMSGIPYTGCTIYSQVVTADKSLTKKVLQTNEIPTPVDYFQPDTEYIIKAKTEHASAGLDNKSVRKFSSEEELQKALDLKKKQTGLDHIAEQYIDGREFSCAFLGQMMLNPVEYVFDSHFKGHKIITYEAKWNEETESYKHHQRTFAMEENIRTSIIALTSKCRSILNIKGYARVDYRMDSDGRLFAIDINTNPCISPDSTFIAMIEQKGISIEEMFDKIIENAFIS
ncbi:MAG: ATP-grasp domain-containing protein [Bacteroidales bacterium]|nr:ATP-grasp domain-containing protein [Bacteroidales bacterium]MDD4670691.1 ATP-grasp domain-containing protein [Bacteroidales bacterium]